MSFADLSAEVQSAEQPWSILLHDGEARFEVREGDRRSKPSERLRPIERSELSFPANPLAFGVDYRVHLEVQFEPGPPYS